MKNDGEKKIIPDIFRRVKVRSKIKDNIALFDRYDVDEGDTPETVSYKLYGSTKYFYIVCLMNDVVNRFFDWPLDEFSFQKFVEDKYTNPGGIHHYEITQRSGEQTGDGPADYSHKIECNANEPGAEAVSNIEYERRLQDKKRQIKVLSPTYLSLFEEELNNLLKRN
tara:strand:- start:1899 stop:2399 length:501 start_codon:yes stop_codon:yes gene_type:complete